MPGNQERPTETPLPLLPPSAAVLVADDEARFLEVNDAAVRLLKYSASQLSAMHAWDITAGPQVGDAKLMWKDFLSLGARPVSIRCGALMAAESPCNTRPRQMLNRVV